MQLELIILRMGVIFMVKEKKICDICEVFNPNKNVIDLMKKNKLQEDVIYELAKIFKTIGEPTRIRLLYVLKERELCVCELSELLEMSPSAISHQLRILRDTKLVKFRKEGRSVYYSL